MKIAKVNNKEKKIENIFYIKNKKCDIYLDNKTCKEYANTTMADKNYKKDPYLERYRKRYQSL